MIGSQRRDGLALIAPLTAFLLALLGFPLAADIVYSLSAVDFQTIRSPTFIGLGNYGEALTDPAFWRAAWFSLRFALLAATAQVLIGLTLAIFLAPILNRYPWLMALLMLPMMVAPALVGLMYRLILHEFVGVVPYYLYLWLGDSPSFLSPATAFRTLVTIEVLQWTPFALLILYTAYVAIGSEVREAARIDGAGEWAMLWRIDLPLMLPTIGIAFFIRFINSFRVFDNVYTLTGTGAGGSTTTMSIYIYETFFRRGEIGVAVAASMLLLVASFLFLKLVEQLSQSRMAA